MILPKGLSGSLMSSQSRVSITGVRVYMLEHNAEVGFGTSVGSAKLTLKYTAAFYVAFEASFSSFIVRKSS